MRWPENIARMEKGNSYETLIEKPQGKENNSDNRTYHKFDNINMNLIEMGF
jgi:hypothetical protein